MPNATASRNPGSSAAARPPAGERYRVFIDFDNTISIGDILDGVIERFAGDESWRTLEALWAGGQIGARACLEGQLLTLRATEAELHAHLDGAKLDPGFLALRDLLRREGVEMEILSDNFDAFIAHILRRHGLADVPVRANHVVLAGGRTLPSFPYANPDCPGCAHCKKTRFVPRPDERRVVYIGDGRSDLCPARQADIVFAKDSLLKQLRADGIACHAYRDLTEVTRALQKILNENVH